MKRRRMWPLTAHVVASCLVSLPASADILIESHQGQRPPDADAVLAAFRAELESSGVKVRASDVVTAAGDLLPLSGISDSTRGRDYTLELSGQVTLGTKQVFHGDYTIGLRTLEDVLSHARANASLVVLDTSSPAWLTKAYAAIAFAQIRSQHVEAASEALTEQIRSFPDDPIGRTVGPEVAALANEVRKKLDAAPHGTLRIIASQPDVEIFVDERPLGRGRVLVTAVPGVYRLLLVRGGVSRRYPSRVLPDKNTDLYVDWDADAAFSATRDWVGFVWSRGQEAKLVPAALRYARGSREHDVIVAGIIVRSGRRYLSGAIFEKKTGALLRQKGMVLDRDDGSVACKRALAQYLMNGSESSCLLDLPVVAAPHAKDAVKLQPENTGRVAGGADERPVVSSRSRAPLYAAAGTAAAAFLAGGYLLHINGKGTCASERISDCALIYSVRGPAWTLIGAGIAAVGFGVYWHLHAPSRAQQSATIFLNPTNRGALATIEGTF